MHKISTQDKLYLIRTQMAMWILRFYTDHIFQKKKSFNERFVKLCSIEARQVAELQVIKYFLLVKKKLLLAWKDIQYLCINGSDVFSPFVGCDDEEEVSPAFGQQILNNDRKCLLLQQSSWRKERGQTRPSSTARIHP